MANNPFLYPGNDGADTAGQQNFLCYIALVGLSGEGGHCMAFFV